jgi:hypothetical protein
LDHVLNNYLAWQALHLFAPAALRATGYEAEAELLEDQRGLYDADIAARMMLERWQWSPELSPVQWAVIRAQKAATLAPYFYSKRDDWVRGIWGDTTYDSCARASAAAAYHASRAGCPDAWDLALFVLDEALTIVKNRATA